MYIDNLMTDPGDDAFYQESFHTVLESHISHFKNEGLYSIVSLQPVQGVVFEGDFFGLLDKINIAKQYHYVVMLFNGYNSPDDFKKETVSILIPNIDELDLLQRQYQTRKTLV